MKAIWPEEKDDEYDRLYHDFDRTSAPGIGSIIHLAKKDNPDYKPPAYDDKKELREAVEKKKKTKAKKQQADAVETVEPVELESAESVEDEEDKIEIPFPMAKMPKSFQNALKGITDDTNAPLEAAVSLALATIATASQHTYNVDPVLFGGDTGVWSDRFGELEVVVLEGDSMPGFIPSDYNEGTRRTTLWVH